MKLNTIHCPHCGALRYARLEGEGGACGFYDYEVDGQCGSCNKWHDDPVEESDE